MYFIFTKNQRKTGNLKIKNFKRESNLIDRGSEYRSRIREGVVIRNLEKEYNNKIIRRQQVPGGEVYRV